MNKRTLVLLALSAALFVGPARAEDFYCEVMSVEGAATLSNATTSGKPIAEGDLLSVNDVVKVSASSYVDIAYDRDWNNVTRVEENSSIRIRSLYPETAVELEEGGVFAKLKSLPKESSFDVQTPTAIASVRGTEYRTTYTGGQTEVYNVSSSDVYVYGVDESGKKQEAEPVIIRNTQKTFVPQRGQAPRPPQKMEQRDIQRAGEFKQGIENRVKQNVERGRMGKLPDVQAIEKRIQERRGPDGQRGQQRSQDGSEGNNVRQDGVNREQNARDGEGRRENRNDRQDGNNMEERGQMEGRGQDGRREGAHEGKLGEPFFPGGDRQRHDQPKKPVQGRPGPRPRAQQ